MAQLRQAQEAFVYGVPLAAFALIRAILEKVLRQHYGATGSNLWSLINSAKDLPKEIHWAQLERMRRLGNDALHVDKKYLINVEDSETRNIIALVGSTKTHRGSPSFAFSD